MGYETATTHGFGGLPRRWGAENDGESLASYSR